MDYLIGLVAILLGGLLFERSRRKSAEGVLENLDTKKELLKQETQAAKNQGLLEAEEEKRKEIKSNEDKKSLDDIARFLNDRK
jgi:hypothetical protein